MPEKKPITCPKCGKRLSDCLGKVHIEGGSILSWCKKCKTEIEIYGDCKTRIPEKTA